VGKWGGALSPEEGPEEVDLGAEGSGPLLQMQQAAALEEQATVS
jgi:hypothetical protein